jgi:DNA-binding MarR family transcriptional regulator
MIDVEAIADGLDRVVLWARRSIPVQMSSTSVTTLSTLDLDGPLRITELAEREGVTQPGMSTVVNRLAASGYAERRADPNDGRVALVQITEAGRQVLDERHAARAEALTALIAELTAEHQRALADAVAALRALTQSTERKSAS